MTEFDDAALDHTLQASDPGRFPTVVRLFKSQARRLGKFLGHKLRNPEDAEDAAQEVFLKLWRREQSGHLHSDATAYMFAAARTVAADCERTRRRHRVEKTVSLEDDEAEQVGGHAPSSEQVLWWQDGLGKFVSSIEELPAQTQLIFMLYHVEGLTHADIAARLGISERSVERHMATALAHCRKRLEDYL